MMLRRRSFSLLSLIGMAQSPASRLMLRPPLGRSATLSFGLPVAENSPQEIGRLATEGDVNAVAWNRDGSRLAALSNSGATVTIWEASDWKVLRSFHRYGGGNVSNSFAYLPDGTLLTPAPLGRSPDPRYKTLSIFSLVQWDSRSGQPVRYIPDVTKIPKGAASFIGPTETFVVSADGSVVAGTSKGDVLLYSTRDWSLIRRVTTPSTSGSRDLTISVAISKGNRYLVLGTVAGFIHLFLLSNGSKEAVFHIYQKGYGDGCSAVEFSPDGQFLAVGSGGASVGAVDNGSIQIWSVKDRKVIAYLDGPRSTVWGIAWDQTGNRLAVVGSLLLRVWTVEGLPNPPRLIEQVPNHGYSLMFSSTGVLAVADSNEVVIYR